MSQQHGLSSFARSLGCAGAENSARAPLAVCFLHFALGLLTPLFASAMATKELPLTFAIDRQAQRTSVLPPELSLLVLDNLASPGTFILLHSITRALKAQRLGGDAAVAQRPVLLLSLSEDEAGWEGLLKKQVRSILPRIFMELTVC